MRMSSFVNVNIIHCLVLLGNMSCASGALVCLEVSRRVYYPVPLRLKGESCGEPSETRYVIEEQAKRDTIQL